MALSKYCLQQVWYSSIHNILVYQSLNFISAPLSPQSNVMLSLIMINSSHLTLTCNWNSVYPNCQAVHYKINVTNCGQCPNATSCGVLCPTSTNIKSISCIIKMLATLPETCTIIILPVVCGNMSGTPLEFIVNGNS